MKNQNKTWIELLPKEWAVGRISYKYQVQLGKMLQPEPKSAEDIKKPYLRSANLDWNGVKLENVKEMWFSSQDLIKYKIEPLDVLVSEGGDVGRTSFWNETKEMYIQNAVNRLRPITDESNPKFLYYWFSFLKTHGLIDIMCDSSTIAHYTAEKVKATQLVFPSFTEQTQIANFLDQKTAQIDKLIAQKEKLLKLLAEKRTAIITQAVTKGLDPKVEMKDSGIDWLGEIPKHWEVKKLKFLASYNDEKLGENEDPDLEIKYVEIGNVDLINGIKVIEELKYKNAPSRARRIARKGDVIISTVRTYLKAIAFINETTENLIVSTGFAVLRSKDNSILHPKYLGFCVQDQRVVEKIVSKSAGVSYPAISPYEIAEISIALPDIYKQMEIIKYLETKLLQQDKAQEIIETSLDQLNEYREAIITAAVTGQIDVRGEIDKPSSFRPLSSSKMAIEHSKVLNNEKLNDKNECF